jgi:hypothetical protein
MDTQYLTIDRGSGDVLTSNVNSAQPQIRGILGTQLNLSVAFARNGIIAPLADSASGKLVLKKLGDPSGPVLAEDPSWTVVDGRYHFSIDLVTLALESLLANELMVRLAACVDWVEDDTGLDLPRKTFDFLIELHNSSSRIADDPAPPPARTGVWFDHQIKLRSVSEINPDIRLNNPRQYPFIFARDGTLHEMDLMFIERIPVNHLGAGKWGFTANWRWIDGEGNLTPPNTRVYLLEEPGDLTNLQCLVIPLMTTPLDLLQGSSLSELTTILRTSFGGAPCEWVEVHLRLRGRYDS